MAALTISCPHLQNFGIEVTFVNLMKMVHSPAIRPDYQSDLNRKASAIQRKSG
jgi:hypothetical protein